MGARVARMASSKSTQSLSGSPRHADFRCGDMVVLVGLDRVDFNQHVGIIVTELGDSGRYGVSLHSEQVGDCGDYPPIALKPENLRLLPKRVLGKPVSVVDSIGPSAVFGLLGCRGWGLPDNAVDHISEFLLINRVSMSDVSVSSCSSSRGDFPLDAVLNDARDEWWISASGSMKQGLGNEYLEFSFGLVPRRVETVALRIPPLPYGPLSVRTFCVKAMNSTGQWLVASPDLQTLDRADLQVFALIPPVDAIAVRIECSKNAAAGSREGRIADCIGLFQVAFS